ncbi:MAG: helix-turn-helix transcriptional regulator [Anaerolineales bacterium]|nr:helix-turn-helix transcriptional regulator [Anaerolineales bacterium]MBS3754058.1 helix-turn-helix transcriptional regulator [Anaerolineales bacterium]
MSLVRELFLGFIKLHILYHAGQEPIYGVWLMEELAEHGYQLSAGTLYPTLHSLEKEGYLASEKKVVDGKTRKYYTLTPEGRKALDKGREKAVELLNEIREGN